MRGKERKRGKDGGSQRITPACAGKSGDVYNSLPIPQGSPPPVRGKAESDSMKNLKSRITPACAGKRSGLNDRSRLYVDHPRLCGEKPSKISQGLCKAGSPPPVRGKVLMMSPLPFMERITPACAGKSTSESLVFVSPSDHPRLCGEKKA